MAEQTGRGQTTEWVNKQGGDRQHNGRTNREGTDNRMAEQMGGTDNRMTEQRGRGQTTEWPTKQGKDRQQNGRTNRQRGQTTE
jgi:hypothetical protein